jgi:hypothetical protein
MKQLNTTEGMKQLSHEEAMAVTGGDDIVTYLRCVSATLGTGGGLFRTFLLGTTIFGMARLTGVMTGCASI